MSEGRPNAATLSVLTFNCWGIPIPFVCKDYKLRMDAISNALFNDSEFDVICLQEIWGQDQFKKFQEQARCVFPYSHYFYSGVLGSGVCVFSRWPIVEALFHKWQVNGYVHKITHGDWYGGKGVGLCRLSVNGYKVNIYTCHTHAEYNEHASYITHKVVQAFDVSQFIHVSSKDADISILAADLNTEPGDLCYRIITNYTNLVDAFQPNSVPYEATFACPSNSYYERSRSLDNPYGDRIDYIMYKGGRYCKVVCVSYSTPLSTRVPGQNFSYSDHEAVCAKLELRRYDESGDAPCESSQIHFSLFTNDVSGAQDSRRKTISKKPAEESIFEAYNICVKAERKLERKIHCAKLCCLGMPVLLLVILYGVSIFTRSIFVLLLFGVVLILFSFVLLFTIYLSLNIERNGILCASKEMKIFLDHIQLLTE